MHAGLEVLVTLGRGQAIEGTVRSGTSRPRGLPYANRPRRTPGHPPLVDPPPAIWAGASGAYGHGLRDLAEFSRDPCRRTARSPHKRHSGLHEEKYGAMAPS